MGHKCLVLMFDNLNKLYIQLMQKEKNRKRGKKSDLCLRRGDVLPQELQFAF